MMRAIIWQVSTGVDTPGHQLLQRNIMVVVVVAASVSDRFWPEVL